MLRSASLAIERSTAVTCSICCLSSSESRSTSLAVAAEGSSVGVDGAGTTLLGDVDSVSLVTAGGPGCMLSAVVGLFISDVEGELVSCRIKEAFSFL